MGDEPWAPGEATRRIRQIASSPDVAIALTAHARERLLARRLSLGEILWLLRSGFVYDPPRPAERIGRFRYTLDGNVGGRRVRLVVVPDAEDESLAIVTVMWVDRS